MKITFLASEPDHGTGGSAYVHRLRMLRRGLEQYGHQTSYVSLTDMLIPRPLLAHPLNIPLLRRHLADADFIHAGGDAIITAGLIKPFIKAQIIHDVHGDSIAEAQLKWTTSREPSRLYQIWQARAIWAVATRTSDASLIVSREMVSWLERMGVAPSRHTLVRNGVDLDLFRPNSTPPPPSPFIVAYAGGFQPWQGLDNLVQAFARIDDPNIKLRIIGFKSADLPFKQQLKTLLGDQVELIDRVPQPDLIDLLTSAHVCAIPRAPHPAVRVAMPTKFGEYLGMGMPTLVCDVDETAAMVRQARCGWVSKSTPDALAATIRQAAATSAEQLTTMRHNARRLAQQEFAWEVIWQRYAQLINQLVEVQSNEGAMRLSRSA